MYDIKLIFCEWDMDGLMDGERRLHIFHIKK